MILVQMNIRQVTEKRCEWDGMVENDTGRERTMWRKDGGRVNGGAREGKEAIQWGVNEHNKGVRDGDRGPHGGAKTCSDARGWNGRLRTGRRGTR